MCVLTCLNMKHMQRWNWFSQGWYISRTKLIRIIDNIYLCQFNYRQQSKSPFRRARFMWFNNWKLLTIICHPSDLLYCLHKNDASPIHSTMIVYNLQEEWVSRGPGLLCILTHYTFYKDQFQVQTLKVHSYFYKFVLYIYKTVHVFFHMSISWDEGVTRKVLVLTICCL